MVQTEAVAADVLQSEAVAADVPQTEPILQVVLPIEATGVVVVQTEPHVDVVVPTEVVPASPVVEVPCQGRGVVSGSGSGWQILDPLTPRRPSTP